MADIKIRIGRKGDVDAVSDLLQATWKDTYKSIYSKDQIDILNERWNSPQALARHIGKPNQMFLIAEKDGAPCGHAMASLKVGGEIWLSKLYVSPAEQGSGVGYKLYEFVLAAYPAAKSIRLEVEPQNIKALRFYQRAGFVNVGRNMCCGGDSDIPSLVMERLL